MSSPVADETIESPAPMTTYGNPETRRRILEAAWQLMEQRGAGVTMAEIGKAAGVSRQAVYLHFTNRVGLLIDLVDHINQRIGLGELLERVRSAPTGRAALEAMMDAHATYHHQVMGVFRVLEIARHHDPEVGAAWTEQMSRRLEDHRRVIRRIAEDGELAEGWDVESAATYFFTTTLHWVWEELITQGGWSVEEARDRLTLAVSRALITDA